VIPVANARMYSAAAAWRDREEPESVVPSFRTREGLIN